MKLKRNVRFVTAASLFDGHDVAINIMRRILQAEGAEVIHLGHNRSANAVVKAAIEEDVQGIAISSYQGGHVEYFSYVLELLKKYNRTNINVFGGGGGVIVKPEIELLEQRGVKKIFSPDDGLNMGLQGMIKHMLEFSDCYASKPITEFNIHHNNPSYIAQVISTIELGKDKEKNPEFKKSRDEIIKAIELIGKQKKPTPVLGITGTGGAGKSSLIDELILRFLYTFEDKNVAVLSIDPTKSKTSGALLGDRIRMNCAENDRVFMRSLATRHANITISDTTSDILEYLKYKDFDLVILETAGIGQSDSIVKDLADISIYVMTPEYGAQSQLEKIDMLDYADIVAINKFDKPQSSDALIDVRKALQRNQLRFNEPLENMPVIGTCAHVFDDLGTNTLFNSIMRLIKKADRRNNDWHFEALEEGAAQKTPLIPKKNAKYLSNIAQTIRDHHDHIEKQASIFDKLDALEKSKFHLMKDNAQKQAIKEIENGITDLRAETDEDLRKQINTFNNEKQNYEAKENSYTVRDQTITIKNYYTSLSHTPIPKIKAPDFKSQGDLVRFIGKENLPGIFPYTAGVFPYKRKGEDPTRMFAGEGMPERTNKRFHYLSLDHEATRLSTAFDSVTLYGENPDLRPDIYGKIGNAGVSVCSLDDAKRLYSGFDLTKKNTSVSMTINGPAPTMLAFFFNAAIDFEVEKEIRRQGKLTEIKNKIADHFTSRNLEQPSYRAEKLPEGHNGMGLLFLGIPSSKIVDTALYNNVKEYVLKIVRGTIQADILKEDQAQNTCIFSTEFSLRMMGDCQEYFIKNSINNFYSVSISGYHIAEAGANPVTQLALTLANGFTLLEYYRARGMNIDDFAKNFSFFFSNGVDPEYAVIGRVARRIWAIALKKIYKANERSQKLKYHIQTSGRSLHAQEIAFNDIRTTLQALYAIADNCNSLHTNAYDEAITTPTEESVRRAVAIQMIINHELGLTKNENPFQGSYFIEYLTNMVEEAVLKIFDSLDARGGVLGAMETMYQRSRIQEESIYYEQKKHNKELPIIGVNTFLKNDEKEKNSIDLMRSSDEEKNLQVKQIEHINNSFIKEREESINNLQKASLRGENTFEYLMEACKFASIGEITNGFYKVGGAYRRAM